MRQATKKRMALKIILTVLLLLTIVLAGFLLGVGNYFYNFALNTSSDTFFGRSDSSDSAEPDLPADSRKAEPSSPAETWFDNCETVQIESSDGLLLTGYQLFDQPSHLYVIACHGYGGQASGMASIAYHFFEMGFRALLPDARGHGQSEGDYAGMGWPERRDIIAWCHYILEQDSNAQIILYGVSMGAATVMMTAGESDLPEAVQLVIEDCGYTSAWDEFATQLDELYGLPPFPILNATSLVTKIRAGWWLGDANALKQIKKCTIPILFIHGEADTFVPFEMVHQLFAAAECPKKLLTVPGAVHAESASTDPEGYWRTVADFVAEYLAD